MKNKRHGLSYTRAYRAWKNMMSRCYRESCEKFEHYGGRGITVCERWHDVQLFYNDMGEPDDGLTLERLDVNGNYEPDNCTWIAQDQQKRNTRRNVIIEYEGKALCISEWARLTGLSPSMVHGRIKRGWPLSEAFTTPNLADLERQHKAAQNAKNPRPVSQTGV